MALGNTYGLLLVSLLLGYGLVDLPRRLWRRACPESELRRLRIMAGAADEALFEAVWELQDCEDIIDKTVKQIERSKRSTLSESGTLSSNPSDDIFYKECVDELIRRRTSTAVLDSELESRRTKPRTDTSNGNITSTNGSDSEDSLDLSTFVPSIDSLSKLNARLKLAQARLVSSEQRWADLIEKSELYCALIENSITPPSPSAVPSTASALSKMWAKFHNLSKYVEYLWLMKCRSFYFRSFSVTTAIFSAAVLWSESTMSIPYNLSLFALILKAFDNDLKEKGILFEIVALIPLIYMSVCVYGSLFKVNLFGTYCLRGYKQSPGVALLFNAQYLIRMQFPLGYNYLLMLKYDTSSHTTCAFSQLMSNMSTVPFFGTSFSVYAPLLILALCFFTFYNVYPRLLAILGVEHEDAILMGDEENLESQLNEGIVLLRRKQRSNNGQIEQPKSEENNNGHWWYNVV